MESVIELIQISTWSFQQRWLSPVTCRPNESITCIRLSSNEQLGLSIEDENNPNNRQFRIELRDISLNILYTFPLHSDSGIFSRMTPLPDGHWAVLNVDSRHVFILNENAELIDKIDCLHEPLLNIALVNENIIVLRGVNKLFFYDVKFHAEKEYQ
jgi:hypothetical protein